MDAAEVLIIFRPHEKKSNLPWKDKYKPKAFEISKKTMCVNPSNVSQLMDRSTDYQHQLLKISFWPEETET